MEFMAYGMIMSIVEASMAGTTIINGVGVIVLSHIMSLVMFAIERKIPIGASKTFQLNMEWISRYIPFECVVILLKSLILIAFALHDSIFRAILFYLWQTTCNLARATKRPPATQ